MTSEPVRLQNPLPSPPDLVLRVGFAGKRELDAAAPDILHAAVTEILTIIGRRLVEIAPGNDVQSADTVPAIANFYSPNAPALRLIHGLCEGADSIAVQALEQLGVACLAKSYAAVVPFDLATYRASRWPEYLGEFDRQAASCSYIIVADGIYDVKDSAASAAKSALADQRRARAYRCQSALLLRQTDLLIAALDPEQNGKPGGTLETVRAALDFELPVVVIHPGTGAVTLIEPGDDFLTLLGNPAPHATDWQATLRGWVTNLVADPDRSDDALRNESASHGVNLMREYFEEARTPALLAANNGGTRHRVSIREHLWTAVERHFKKDLPKLPVTARLPAYAGWRARAAELSSHYSGLYRGTYILNHLLAVAAVFLAALSLVLIVHSRTPLRQSAHSIATAVPHEASGSGSGLPVASTPPPRSPHPTSNPATRAWLLPTLLILGGLKLWIVVSIFRNTHRANRGDWNDRAVDYRYLAERLRALNYLPLAGSFQPPAATPPQYASRVVRQSAVDWLFDAILRSVSPLAFARETLLDTGGGKCVTVQVLVLEPLVAMRSVSDGWIAAQAIYHHNNATTMQRMSESLERQGKRMNLAVIVAVAADIVVVLTELCHVLPSSVHPWLVVLAPWLLFLAALLPAAVAGLNGIRFQSECQRLAERSAVMHTILEGRQENQSPRRRGRLAEARQLIGRITAAHADASNNPGAWTLESLHFSEKIADDFVQEVAEWSVLYAKELVEP